MKTKQEIIQVKLKMDLSVSVVVLLTNEKTNAGKSKNMPANAQ